MKTVVLVPEAFFKDGMLQKLPSEWSWLPIKHNEVKDRHRKARKRFLKPRQWTVFVEFCAAGRTCPDFGEAVKRIASARPDVAAVQLWHHMQAYAVLGPSKQRPVVQHQPVKCNARLIDELPRVALYSAPKEMLLPIARNSEEDAVDAVVVWVDGADKKWRELFQKHTGKKPCATRYGGNGADLRWCLASLVRNVPFLRHIHLVTMDQRPDWIDQPAYAKVKIVHHAQIFDSQHLPSFNSSAIEMVLHRIPGLSEHFLYSNDDMFVLRPTTRQDWFWQDGRPKMFQHHTKRRAPACLRRSAGSKSIPNFDLHMFSTSMLSARGAPVRPAHQIGILCKSVCAWVFREYRNTVSQTLQCKTRSNCPFVPNLTQYAYWWVMLDAGIGKLCPLPAHDNVYLDFSKSRLPRREARILSEKDLRPRPMLCVANNHELRPDRGSTFFKILEKILSLNKKKENHACK